MKRFWGILIFFPLVASPLVSSPAVKNYRVLVLYSDSRQLPGIAAFDEKFSSELKKDVNLSVDILKEFLDINRFPDEAYKMKLGEFLRYKYGKLPLDAIVTVRAPTLHFALDHRTIFGKAPIVYSGAARNEFSTLPADVVGVPMRYEPDRIVGEALRLHPWAKQLVVITGASDHDLLWEKILREKLKSFEKHIAIDYWSAWPMDRILSQIKTLPSDAIVFTPGIVRDGNGQEFVTIQFISEISQLTPQPLYAAYDTAIGNGAVGVYMTPINEIARQTASLTKNILRGVPLKNLSLPDQLSNQFIFDAQQLIRLGIPESSLPVGSEVRLKKPNTKILYHKRVLIITMLCILELCLIFFLFYQYHTRTRTESELRKSERALGTAARAAKHSEERFRLVVDSMPIALFMVDSKGSITLSNSRAEILFGYTRAEMHGFQIEQLMPARFRGQHTRLRNAFFADPHTRPMGGNREIFCLTKNGDEIPVDIWLSPIKIGNEIFILASVTDISDRRKSEIEVERQRAQLTHLSRVEMLSHFSGSLAHELNQPLTAMLTNVQVAKRLLDRPVPDKKELQAIMQDVIADNRRASDIVTRLRGWLKKEVQRTAENDVNSLVEEVVQFFKTEFLFHKVACAVDLHKSPVRVHCDRVQIQQVITNLFKNALETNRPFPDGGRQFSIRTAFLDNREEAVISITDDGDGIADQIKKDIFNPFVTTKKSGLGMGLSICQTIVLNHKGRIWAENNSDRGATFHFSLPVSTRTSI